MKVSKGKVDFFLFLLGGILLLSSCRKDRIEIDYNILQTPSTGSFADVYFFDEQSGVVGGGKTYNYGDIYFTNDGGSTWQGGNAAISNITAVDFTQNGHGVATAYPNHLLFTADSGKTWNDNYFTGYQMRGVDFYDDNTGIVVGGINYQNGYIGVFNALNTNPVNVLENLDNEIMDVVYLSPTSVVSCGYGLVQYSEDGGYTWHPCDVEGDQFVSLNFPSPSVGYGVGYFGTIIKTTDGGKSWKKLRNGGSLLVKDLHFKDVFFIDDEKGYVVGEGSIWWRTLNGGKDWEVVKNTPSGLNLNCIDIKNGVGYIACSDGKIITFAE